MGKESFLKKTVEAAMFAGAVATTGAVFESKEPVVDRNALFLQLKRDIEELGSASPIDYHVLSEASKTRIEPFIGAVDAFAHQYNLAYGIDMKEGARLESTQAPAPSQQVLLHIRMGLWERMRGSFPDLPAYTDEQFYHTMVHLPERLAPLGVRTEAGVFASYTSDQNIYDITVAFGRFLPIKRIERLSRTYFGRAVEVPVLYFGSPLGKNTQGPSGQEMVTMFGAVGIFSNTGERQAGEWMHARKKIPEALKIYENQYGSPPLQEPFRGDYLIYSTLNDLVQKEDPPSKLELFDSVFAHEAGGHVVDDSDPAYKKALIPSDSELMDQKPEYILHALSHAEVDGLLSGLRYGEGNLGLYALLVNLLSDHEQTGPTHHYAARWIGDRLAPVILKKPDAFGIHIQAVSSYSPEEQVLLALPTIQRQKPALLRDTWEELWKLHRAQLSKRIYTDSLTEPSVPKKKEPPSEKKEGNSGISLILVAGVGVFATLLAGRAALKLREKALAERTVLEKQIETIHAALGGVENSKKLIEDLQLGVSGKSLDPARREIAYKKIIEIARVSGNVRSVLKNIRVLIGVDT